MNNIGIMWPLQNRIHVLIIEATLHYVLARVKLVDNGRVKKGLGSHVGGAADHHGRHLL